MWNRLCLEIGNKNFPALEAFTLQPLLLPLPCFPQIPHVPPQIQVGWEHGWCLHSIPLPEKQGERQHSLQLQGFLQNIMLQVKNWDRERTNLKKIYFPAKIFLERGVTVHAVGFEGVPAFLKCEHCSVILESTNVWLCCQKGEESIPESSLPLPVFCFCSKSCWSYSHPAGKYSREMLRDGEHVLPLQFLAATWLWKRIQSKTKTKDKQFPLLGNGGH